MAVLKMGSVVFNSGVGARHETAISGSSLHHHKNIGFLHLQPHSMSSHICDHVATFLVIAWPSSVLLRYHRTMPFGSLDVTGPADVMNLTSCRVPVPHGSNVSSCGVLHHFNQRSTT